MKEVKTSRKPKRSTFQAGGRPKLPVNPAQPPTSLKLPTEPKKEVPDLSEGEIDERETAPTSNAFDERSFTLVTSDIQTAFPWPLPADHTHKTSQTFGGVLDDYYAAESSSTFDLIDLTSPVSPSPPPAGEPIPPPPPSPPPPPPPPPPQQQQQQNLPKPSPALVQSKLTQFASNIPINNSSSTIASSNVAASTVASSTVASSITTTTTGRAWGDRSRDLRAELNRMKWNTRRRQADMRARVEAETTGCVPALNGPAVDVGGVHLAAAEREMYESRLRAIEGRMVALERAQRDEVDWSRAMGRFLYDANDRSVRALDDAFSAIGTLERASSALFDELKRHEE